jgi:hypothetical protein
MPRPTLKPENVVFELGFFIGKLGPAYVAALLKSAAEKPSGFDGIAYIPYGPVHPGRPSSCANAPREIPSIPRRFLGLNSPPIHLQKMSACGLLKLLPLGRYWHIPA